MKQASPILRVVVVCSFAFPTVIRHSASVIINALVPPMLRPVRSAAPLLPRGGAILCGAVLLLSALSGCQPRPTAQESSLLRCTLETAVLFGLTVNEARDAIIAQGAGIPLMTSAADNPFSTAPLAQSPAFFNFPRTGTVGINLNDADAFTSNAAPFASGTATVTYKAVEPGESIFVGGRQSGNVTYQVVVTLTSRAVCASPVDGSTVSMANGSSYAFVLRLNWTLGLPSRIPTWTMSSAMDLTDVTIAASGVHVVENWDIVAHGDRLAVVILNANNGYLNVSRALAAHWSMTLSSGGQTHTLVWDRPQINIVTLTIDGVVHGPFTNGEFFNWCGESPNG